MQLFKFCNYLQLNEFFIGTENEKPLVADIPLAQRLDECFQALKNALQVVAIDLEQDDDAQVIFETLNARGEPLLPVDFHNCGFSPRFSRASGSPWYKPPSLDVALFSRRFNPPRSVSSGGSIPR